MAPGGKLVATCIPHMRIARAHKVGAARIAATLNIMKKFVLTVNKSSIVETFMVEIRSRYQRY
jgi:hypothetical protein